MQSWPKLLAFQNFFQKKGFIQYIYCNYTCFVILMLILFMCIGTQKNRKKAKHDIISSKTPKMGKIKLLAPFFPLFFLLPLFQACDADALKPDKKWRKVVSIFVSVRITLSMEN